MIARATSRGLSAAAPLVNLGSQIASIGVTGMAGLASISSLGLAGSAFAAAIPFAGIAVALFELLSNVFGLGSGCGQTCVMTTQIVNKLEPYLQQNVDAYMSGGHTQSEQATALALFDNVWAAVQQGCSSGALQGTGAGQRCVTDRQSGACVWKSSAFGWINGQFVPSGPNGSGSQCWNWFSGYRDPIANDPTVRPDPSPLSTVGSELSSVFGASGMPSTPLLVAAGLLAAAIIIPRFL